MGNVAFLPPQWLHGASNPLLLTLNALQSQHQPCKLVILLFCLPCLQILVTAEVDGGNPGKARLDVLSFMNIQHMKKIPDGIVPIWTATIAVQAQPLQLPTHLENLGDHITVKNCLQGKKKCCCGCASLTTHQWLHCCIYHHIFHCCCHCHQQQLI